MNNSQKYGRILLITISIFVLSTVLLFATLTGGFSVEKRKINFVTDEGVNLSATLFAPKTASADQPVPGIAVAPGGNTPHTFYASYSIELARRGYVVLAYDYYGTMSSDFSTAGSSGATAAMKYLTGLSFVDNQRLGAIGHSNGGGQALAAITSDYAAGAENRSVLFIGCGVAGQELAVYNNINVAAIWGKLDEAGQGVFWDVYHEDKLNFGSFATLINIDSKDVQPGKWYQNEETGAKRVVYTPNTFHSLSNIAPGCVTDILTYMDTTLTGNSAGIPAASHIYLWQELAVLIMAVSLCVMIFPAGAILLETPFFKSLKRPVSAGSAKADLKFWIFLLLPGIISALIVKSTIIQGQTILGKLPNLFKVQSTNGFVWWFFLSSLIGLLFFVVRTFIDKNISRNEVVNKLKTTPKNFGKAVLFGLATVALPYLFAVMAERTVGWYGRIFQTYFAPVSANRLTMFPVYFLLFGLMFTVSAFLQVDTMRFKKEKPLASYVLTLLSNALPAILFVVFVFGKLIITRVTPIDGREMSRALGAMMGMLLLYFVISKITVFFYKKSGNMYVCAMVNTALVVWMSINTQQLMV